MTNIQNQTGFDVTNRMRGEVPYSSLQILHIAFIFNKLEIRGAMFEIGRSIKKLATALKENDLKLQKQGILQKTRNNNLKDSELNFKNFLTNSS